MKLRETLFVLPLLVGCDDAPTTPPDDLVIPDAARFTVRGAWDDSHALTVRIDAEGGSMSAKSFERAARRALELWSETGAATFTDADPDRVPSFSIGWNFQRGATVNDGIAQAGGVYAGSWCALDPSIAWDDESAATAALVHEIGHLLGLDHNEDPNSIMFPLAGEARRGLGPLDRAGIHSLYGGGGPPAPGDVIVLHEDGSVVRTLRHVAPPGTSDGLVMDLDGDGTDEFMAWIADGPLFGSTWVYRFTKAAVDGGGPRLARTDGPLYAYVGKGEVRPDEGLEGERVLVTLLGDSKYRLVTLDDNGRPSNGGLAPPVQLLSGLLDDDGDGIFETGPDPLPLVPLAGGIERDGERWKLTFEGRVLQLDRVWVGDLDGDLKREWLVRVVGSK